MSRLKYIDALKGFAIIFVVIGHVSNGYLSQGTADMLFVNTHKIATAFHMALFFAVSGFLFCRAYISDEGTVKNARVKTQTINLICIYFLYSILLWTFKFLLSAFVNTQLTVKNLLMIPIKPFDLYWYLYIVILYYIIFSRRIVVKQPKLAVLLVTIALAITSYWVPDTWLFGIKNFLYFMPFFYLGCLLSSKAELLDRKELVYILLPIIILLFTLFWRNEEPLKSIRFVNLAIGGGTALCLFCAFKQYKLLGENRFLSFVGSYSLEIYLFHTYFVTFCRTVFSRMNINNSLLILIISTSLGVAAPIGIAWVCRKIGIHKYLFTPYKELVKAHRIKENE